MIQADKKTQAIWKRTGDMLRMGHSPKKKSISEMDLSEVLDLQGRFIKWSKKYPKHPEILTKTHIYEKYILPRIDALNEQKLKENSNYVKNSFAHKEKQAPREDTGTEKNYSNKYATTSYSKLRRVENTMSQWLVENKHDKESSKWKEKKKEYTCVVFWMDKKSDSLSAKAS